MPSVCKWLGFYFCMRESPIAEKIRQKQQKCDMVVVIKGRNWFESPRRWFACVNWCRPLIVSLITLISFVFTFMTFSIWMPFFFLIGSSSCIIRWWLFCQNIAALHIFCQYTCFALAVRAVNSLNFHSVWISITIKLLCLKLPIN